MRTYTLTGSGVSKRLTDTDLRYLASQVRKDVRYQRSRSAKRTGNGKDANACKIKAREELAEKLDAVLKGATR